MVGETEKGYLSFHFRKVKMRKTDHYNIRFFSKGFLMMDLEVFSYIVNEKNAELRFCREDSYLRSQLSDYEITILVPLAQAMMASNSFVDFLNLSYWTIDYLQESLFVTDQMIKQWMKKGFPKYDKYTLTFYVISYALGNMRFRAQASNTNE